GNGPRRSRPFPRRSPRPRRCRPAAAAAGPDRCGPRRGHGSPVLLLVTLVLAVPALIVALLLVAVLLVVIAVIVVIVAVLGVVLLIGAGAVLDRRRAALLGAVRELQNQLDLVAGLQGSGQCHQRDVVAARVEHELVTGRDREAALLLLHAHPAGAVGGGLMQFDLVR